MRLTYGDIKATVGLPINLCGTHESLLPMVNEACELLWHETDWPGKHVRYKIRVSGECGSSRIITWPRAIETIEKVDVCGEAIGVRDMWFEFLDNGTGLLENHPSELLADIGESCTFGEISGVNKKLKVYADVAEAADAKILLLGYDENNNWIRTQDLDGNWQDGEYVAISADAPTVSVNYFTKLTGVQKPETNGTVRLYALDTDTLIEHSLAIYEYDETIPVYRRSRLTGANNTECECVTVIGKRRFIPIKRDTDYVYPPHLPALKTMLIALHKRDNASWQEFTFAASQAKYMLQKMNQQYRGAGALRRVSFVDGATWGAGRNVQ